MSPQLKAAKGSTWHGVLARQPAALGAANAQGPCSGGLAWQFCSSVVVPGASAGQPPFSGPDLVYELARPAVAESLVGSAPQGWQGPWALAGEVPLHEFLQPQHVSI